jgi:Fanconi anemia group J protein
MEDLAEAVDHHAACAFFTMKKLHEDAELVLCPYNYIFDANIRDAMGIELGNAAVVIDEGHNVEDVCREGASKEIPLSEMEKAVTELEFVGKKFEFEASAAQRLINPLAGWLKRELTAARDAANRAGRSYFNDFNGPVKAAPGDRIWKGPDAAAAICAGEALGPSPALIRRMRAEYPAMYATDRDAAEAHVRALLRDAQTATSYDGALMKNVNESAHKYGAGSVALVNAIAASLTTTLDNARDFAACACADIDNPGSGVNNNNSRFKPRPGLALWCLRPAVAFRSVAREALCVILTSGTLSPVDSLESELGVEFPVKVEAPHIVPRRQLHVEASDALGDFTRKTQESDKMPGNLGSLLLKYVKVTPGGVLVFLPKYSLIQRVIDEWAHTGMLEELEKHKRVVYEEPGAETLAPTMETFKDAIESGRGGVFLAVYRGKVSEGLDFKDANARAVFCVGIPFPSLGDVKVKLKREYNNHVESKKQGLMSGGEWYTHQAFRAYNQALGRCVRHQFDYACIFLVDARFCMHDEASHNKRMVSKWMRNLVTHYSQSRESVGTVREFFDRLKSDPPGPKPVPTPPKAEPAAAFAIDSSAE